MADQPNILFIISDQMTAALTGVYGHPVVQTPHLQRIAADGVRFDAAYTAFPLCAPGRACLLAGRHASEIGAWDNGALLASDQVSFAHYLTMADPPPGTRAPPRAPCSVSSFRRCKASAPLFSP